MRGLEGQARKVFDARLRRNGPRPLAVALSGGGDSVALLLIADAWAREVGRDLLVLNVDHRLQPAGVAWATACAALAERFGRPFRALRWEGDKPMTGLPAAARRARHRLLANAAREAGAQVILMGHTADDVLEAALMRKAGATTPAPQVWAPSPVWPEGRELFVLRPLLGLRRADLRRWLVRKGASWIEDPANTDPRFARSRVRPEAGMSAVGTPEVRGPLALAHLMPHATGLFRTFRSALQVASPEDVAQLLAVTCVVAGGGERRPAGPRLLRAAAGVRADDPFVATLAGARIEAREDMVHICREPGEAARGGLAPLELEAGTERVWDGRYAIMARRPGLTVRAVAGVARRLPPAQRRRLALFPPPERGALPVLVDRDGSVSSPLLGGEQAASIQELTGRRYLAAAGLILREYA